MCVVQGRALVLMLQGGLATCLQMPSRVFDDTTLMKSHSFNTSSHLFCACLISARIAATSSSSTTLLSIAVVMLPTI